MHKIIIKITPDEEIDIMLGATAMLTLIHDSWGVRDNCSIASFNIPIPVALFT